MSRTENEAGNQTGEPTTGELHAEIEETRRELGATVDALSEKLDIKHRASRRVESVRREHGAELLAVAGGISLVAVVAVAWSRRR